MQSNDPTRLRLSLRSIQDRGVATSWWVFSKYMAVAFALCLASQWRALAAKGLSISDKTDVGTLEVSYGDQKLLVYAFAGKQLKPYVKALYTLKGDNVLLDAPPDHLHHHGLMYAIRVNGVNFWEEATDPGHEVSAQPPEHSVGVGATGLPQAAIMHLIRWVAHTNAGVADTAPVALLVERRTIIVAVDEKQQEVALQWRSDFEVGPAAPKVTLAGADYHGLGVRFARSFDRVAIHSNSGNLPYPTKGKRDVLEAKWSAVANKWDGREAMLALFARPAETRGPTKFFSMLEPFAYLSATQGLDLAPQEYRRGDKFSLRYLVTVYPAIRTARFLQERYQAWLKE